MTVTEILGVTGLGGREAKRSLCRRIRRRRVEEAEMVF